MKKVSIIYWSCGGNIEALANTMADGARGARSGSKCEARCRCHIGRCFRS